jgi:Ribonuclease G/E
MTKVQTTFKLSRPLTDRDLKEISRVHSIYGMLTTRVEPSGDALFIEYDASRLSKKEVSAVLEEHGFPLSS